MSQQVSREHRRQGQEGNRWVNQLPSGEDISKWFEANVKLADGLDHKEYVGGVTLIPNEEKAKAVVGWDGGNNPIIAKVEDLVYTPYMRVETRIKYFWDMMEAKGTIGFIEPVLTPKADPSMPPGFFKMVIPTGPDVGVRFVCCAMRVTVYEGDVTYEKVLKDKRTGEEEIVRRGKVLIAGAPATKMVPTLAWEKADTNSVMKAETGAIGRALGMAGMLVIPGTGIATAEDMQELGSQGGAPAAAEGAEEAELPDGPLVVEARSPADNDQVMRDEIATILKGMQEYPETLSTFKAWADSRGHKRLSEVTSPALRGMHKKAVTMLNEAAAAAEQKPAEEPKPAPKPAAKAKPRAKAKAKPPAKADTPPPGPLR